ncbi:MAG: hypothetical protein OEM02_03695 [Desulfobulbaceae bacterium]|nr:hypothetical protein [Desulfobulbaceae bacterium]
MAAARCKKCNNIIIRKATACRYCGERIEKISFPSAGRVLLFVLMPIAVFLLISRIEWVRQTNDEIRKIDNQVVQYVLHQYEMVKEQGDPYKICHQASIVRATYFEVNDVTNYRKWKKIEKSDCKRSQLH